MYEAGELTVAQIAAEFGVTRPTIYRHLNRLDQLDASNQPPTSSNQLLSAQHRTTRRVAS